jgi:hydroxymethylpyrimidine/phosphomethylpyrimidine kinase
MTATPQVVLTIAGFDPSSGAGITADIKTIAAHHLYGMSCITSLTVQSTQGVQRVQAIDSEIVLGTLECLLKDVRPVAVKIGMLGSGEVARIVANWLREHRPSNVVLDPVLRSSSGTDLLDSAGIEVLKAELLSLADVVTPNLDEASILTSRAVANVKEMKAAAVHLQRLGARNIVIKGGHMLEPTDLLAETTPQHSLLFREYPGERIDTPNTHGTGCAFSTALACNLGVGMAMIEAVGSAKQYVAQALRESYAVGKGPGPVNHLFGTMRSTEKNGQL